MIADIEELENLDASQSHARRLNAKEVKTSIQDYPERDEEHNDDLR